MKIKLYHRSIGVHSFIKEIEIAGTLRRYAKIIKEKNPNVVGDFYTINEQRLIDNIPKKFLPTEPKNILLTIEDKDGGGSTGQSNLKIFKNYGKYFNTYSLELSPKQK